MPRHPTPRPPSEHHAILSRIFRQVGTDKKLPVPRRKKILKLLSDAMSELQAEIGK